jgi:hypothetical protein
VGERDKKGMSTNVNRNEKKKKRKKTNTTDRRGICFEGED